MIRQREFLQRNRRRVALLAVLAGLVVALAAEHSGLESAHMDHGGMEAVSMCLAILGGGALALGAAALARGFRRARPVSELPSVPTVSLALAATAVPTVRGSPALLQVFRR